MQTFWPPDYGVWRELLLVLAVGATAIVAAAAAASACFRAVVWQRTIWQAGVFGLLALVAVEVTGTGRGLVRWCRPRSTGPLETDGNAGPIADSANRAAFPNGNLSGMTTNGVGPLRRRVPTIENLPGGTARSVRVEPSPAVAPGLSRFTPITPEDLSMTASAVREEAADRAWWPAMLWAAGTATLLIRLCWAGMVLALYRQRRPAVRDDSLRRRVDALARQMGLRRRVRVLSASGLRAPVAFGIFRPSIALPEAFTEHFDSQQQQAMLAHELAHLAAGDPAAQWLGNLACAVLWWHPAAWWLRRQLCAASEAAADEASLLVPGGPDLLADCLVKLGRRLKHPAELGWLSMAGAGFRSALGRRVERLWNLPTRSWQAPGRGRLLAAKAAVSGAFVLVAVSCTAWAQSQAPFVSSKEGGTTMSIFSNSWRSSLAATALWALFSPAPTDAVAQSAPEKQAPAQKPLDATALPGGVQNTFAEVFDNEDSKRADATPTEAKPTDTKPTNVGKQKKDEKANPKQKVSEAWLLDAVPFTTVVEVRGAVAGTAGGTADPQAAKSQKAAMRERVRRQRELAEQAWQICQKIDSLAEGQKDQAQALHAQLERIEDELGQTLGTAAGPGSISRATVGRAGAGDAFWVDLPPGKSVDYEGGKVANGVARLPGPGGSGAQAGFTIAGTPNYGPAPDRDPLLRRMQELEQMVAQLSKEGKGEEMQRRQQELDQVRKTLWPKSAAPQPGQPFVYLDPKGVPAGAEVVSEKPSSAPSGVMLALQPGQPHPQPAAIDLRFTPAPVGQAYEIMGSAAITPAKPDAAVVSLQKQVQDMQQQMEEMRALLKKMIAEKEQSRGR